MKTGYRFVGFVHMHLHMLHHLSLCSIVTLLKAKTIFHLHLYPLDLAQYWDMTDTLGQDGEHSVSNNRIRRLCTGYQISGHLDTGKTEGLSHCQGLVILLVTRKSTPMAYLQITVLVMIVVTRLIINNFIALTMCQTLFQALYMCGSI